MRPNNKLDDRMNGLTVAAVIVLSIGLNISVFRDDIVHAADTIRVATAFVVAPRSAVTAMLLAQQMPR